MKSTLTLFALFAATAFFAAGCGKSKEDLDAEKTANAEVMKMHDDAMALIKKMDDADTQLAMYLLQHDSLVAAKPAQMSEHNADDISKARGRISTAKMSMESWMKAHHPYSENMKHDEAVKKLAADKEDLTNAIANMEGALKAAADAGDNHMKLMTQMMPKGKKGKK